MTLKQIVQRAVEIHGTQDVVGDLLGVNASRISRILNVPDGTHSFEIATLLRLAKAVGYRASEVLIAANKVDAAALLAELYGPEPEPKPPVVFKAVLLTEAERVAIEKMRADAAREKR